MNYDNFNYPGHRAEHSSELVTHRGHSIDHAGTIPPGYGRSNQEPNEGFNFWETLRVILRRKWLILSITLLGVAIATVLTLRVEPLYRATTTIEVQREETRIMEGSSVDPANIADAEYMATQYALLKSRSLAERVAEVLDLPADERYADQNLSRQERLNQAATKIVDNIRVTPEGRSRVINVQYISPHRREAARISNAIVENFIETNLERKYNTTAYARRFIEERLETAKQALEQSERSLVEYASQEDILELGAEGSETSLDANSIISLNNELATAESIRISAEQRFVEARDNPTTRQMLESEALDRLRARRSLMAGEYQELLGKFKPDYPDMVQLQTRIEALDTEIEAEKASILKALESEYHAAISRENSLRQRVAELKSSLQSLRDRRIEYTILAREVDTNRSQYEALLQRMKEVSIAAGVGSSQVSIIDRALVPDSPFEPNIVRTVIQSFLLSFIAGLGLAFVLNYIDDTIATPEDSKTKLALHAIGVVPKLKGAEVDIQQEVRNPKSTISEAFFSTRTALQFTTPTGAPRSLLITSTRPGEGKTSTTIALAMAFAKIGRSVLVIDADMRKPSFVAEAGSSIGLSGMLTREAVLQEQIVRSATQGLYLLPAGTIPPNSAELLSSPRLRQLISEAEAAFDIVIVDSPPVLSFADAPLLGSICEGAIVVIQSGAIRTPAALHTIGRLMDSQTKILGTILTKFDIKSAGYHDGYSYYAYGKGAYAYNNDNLSDAAIKRRKIDILTGSDYTEPTDDSATPCD